MNDIVHHELSIGVPSAWEDISVVTFLGPQHEGYSPSITVTRERLPASVPAADYASSQRIGLEQEFRSLAYHIIAEGPLSLRTLVAFQRMHTFVLPDTKATIQQLQVYLIHDTLAITITCTDLAVHFPIVRPQFEEAIASFRFLDD